MTEIETAIAILCYQCPRRQNACDSKSPPTWEEAYGCMYNEAERLLTKLDIKPR